MKKLVSLLALTLSALFLLTSCTAATGTPGSSPSPTPDISAGESPAESPDETPLETPAETPEESPEETAASALEGSSEEIITALIEQSEIEFGMVMFDALSAETSEGVLDLPADLFSSHVSDAYTHQSMITASAYLSAVLRCTDEEAAAEVYEALKNFNEGRWVCVIPEECYVMRSGVYVFFGASRAEDGLVLRSLFEEMAGGSVEQDIFYVRPA